MLKTSIEELAIFGGQPAFDTPLVVGRPNVGDRGALAKRFDDILDRRWFTNNGRWVETFEDRISQLVGTEVVATCNGTVALQIAARALDLKGEVILPAFTFIATPHALEWIGLTPVFCDVREETHTLDATKAEELIGPNTSAIVGVHLWGQPCDVDELTALSEAHGLRLIFDAAHAFGSSYRGTPLGRFGDAEVFSFHATKVINSFEGGAICTEDPDLATYLRQMRDFGFVGYDRVESPGTNGKMSEVAGAMGVTSLESISQFTECNRRNYQAYSEAVANLPGIRLVEHSGGEPSNHQYIVWEIDAATAGLSRDQLQRALWAEGVHCRRYFYPGCHRMEPYRSRDRAIAMPVTERLGQRVLCMPTGCEVTPDVIEAVVQLARICLEHADAISRVEPD